MVIHEALSHIQLPAYVLAPTNTVLAANEAGRRFLLEGEATRDGQPLFESNHAPHDERAACRLVVTGHDGRPLAPNSIRPIVELTPREVEVTDLLLAGKTNRAIADELGCSIRTVEVHVTRIFRKTGTRSRAELIVRMGKQRDISPDKG